MTPRLDLYTRIDYGITIRNTIDCLIATYCITNEVTLLHSDRDFSPFAEHLGLTILHP